MYIVQIQLWCLAGFSKCCTNPLSSSLEIVLLTLESIPLGIMLEPDGTQSIRETKANGYTLNKNEKNIITI